MVSDTGTAHCDDDPHRRRLGTSPGLAAHGQTLPHPLLRKGPSRLGVYSPVNTVANSAKSSRFASLSTSRSARSVREHPTVVDPRGPDRRVAVSLGFQERPFDFLKRPGHVGTCPGAAVGGQQGVIHRRYDRQRRPVRSICCGTNHSTATSHQKRPCQPEC